MSLTKPFLFLVFLFVGCSQLAAQDTMRQVFLWKTTLNDEGVSTNQSIHLSGAAAQQFNWAEEIHNYSRIIIHRILPADAQQLEKGDEAFNNSAWNVLKQVRTIHESRNQKDRIIYHRNLELADEEMMFFSTAQATRLPYLYLGRPLEDQIRLDLDLRWSEPGECPTELGEYELDPGQIRVLFKDEKGTTLMKRSIITHFISNTPEEEIRVVEIDVQLSSH